MDRILQVLAKNSLTLEEAKKMDILELTKLSGIGINYAAQILGLQAPKKLGRPTKGSENTSRTKTVARYDFQSGEIPPWVSPNLQTAFQSLQMQQVAVSKVSRKRKRKV